MIPTHIWKAVHVPGLGGIVVVATNEKDSQIDTMNIDQFSGKYGIDPFPSLSTAQRQKRSEEHTSELQSLMRISYAVFCLKKKTKKKQTTLTKNNIYNTKEYTQ